MNLELDENKKNMPVREGVPALNCPMAVGASLDLSDKIVGVLDDKSDVLEVAKLNFEGLGAKQVVELLQEKQSAIEIADFMLQNGIDVLYTDNDMNKVLGVQVIEQIALRGGNAAKNIAFVVYTGQPEMAGPQIDELNKKPALAGCRKVILLGKPSPLAKIQAAIQESSSSVNPAIV